MREGEGLVACNLGKREGLVACNLGKREGPAACNFGKREGPAACNLDKGEGLEAMPKVVHNMHIDIETEMYDHTPFLHPFA